MERSHVLGRFHELHVLGRFHVLERPFLLKDFHAPPPVHFRELLHYCALVHFHALKPLPELVDSSLKEPFHEDETPNLADASEPHECGLSRVVAVVGHHPVEWAFHSPSWNAAKLMIDHNHQPAVLVENLKVQEF